MPKAITSGINSMLRQLKYMLSQEISSMGFVPVNTLCFMLCQMLRCDFPYMTMSFSDANTAELISRQQRYDTRCWNRLS